MFLNPIIYELLFKHQCVTIPRFGAFLTQTVGVSITDRSSFNPPTKEITFNSLLVSNDGILAHCLAHKENISFEQSLSRIEKEVSLWKTKLQTQALIFDGIGELRLNASKKLEFSPLRDTNFDTQAFGLHQFIRKPLLIPLSNLSPPPKSLFKMEDTKKDKFMFTPENNRPRRNPTSKYAAIAIISISLIGAIYYFGDQYVTEQHANERKIAQREIKKKVQEATFDLGTLSKIELNLNANQNKSITRNSLTPVKGTYYSVIAGSFRSLENAKKKIESLKEEGFKAELATPSANGLYRVAYGRFESKKEAINLLLFLSNDLGEQAWYLVEK